ncbi:MAG: site-specific integrase [Betaproteobacteria bacterium]|nr:site-specific integrase [Betaproteobacteria bacterium]
MTTKTEFTQSEIGTLPAPVAGRTFYHDANYRGLALRVSASGERVFYLYKKVAGRPVKVALGPFDPNLPASREITKGVDPIAYIGNRPPLNLKMARALAQAVANELAKGTNPAKLASDARRARDGELDLAAAFTRYEIDYLIPEGKRSTLELRQMFERYLGAIGAQSKRKHGRQRTKSEHGVDWSARKLSAIAAGDVRKMMVKLKEGHGLHTANRAFELLRAVYNFAIKAKLYDGNNPCAELSKFKEESRGRFVQGEELPRFFAAIGALPDGSFKDFVLLSLYTGARRSNVLGMRWADVDLHAELWTVPAADSKNKKPMTLPLTRRAADILQARRAADPDGAFVFPAASASGHMTPPKKQWAALMKAAKLTDLHLQRLAALDRIMGSDDRRESAYHWQRAGPQEHGEHASLCPPADRPGTTRAAAGAGCDGTRGRAPEGRGSRHQQAAPGQEVIREIVRLMRAANDGDREADRRLSLLAANFRPSRAALDADAAIRELRDLAREPSPELRYALARWIDGRIALKRGRKPQGVARIVAGAQREALDAALCTRALLTFGSTSAPIGLHPNTRAALVDLLTGARKLKRGPRLAPASTLRTVLAAHNVRLYVVQGTTARAAIRRAAGEASVKPGTLQRHLYPRAK